MLDGEHLPGREVAAVADPIHLVEDRGGGVPGAEEVRVKRVDDHPVDGPGGRNQRLACDLPTEHPLAVLVGAPTPKQVHLDGLEIEEFDEAVDRFLIHRAIVAPECPPRGIGGYDVVR